MKRDVKSAGRRQEKAIALVIRNLIHSCLSTWINLVVYLLVTSGGETSGMECLLQFHMLLKSLPK